MYYRSTHLKPFDENDTWKIVDNLFSIIKNYIPRPPLNLNSLVLTMVSIVRSILIAIITTCGQAALFEWSASSSSAASSWYYTGRFCFRPQVNANPSTSVLNVTIPYALRQIPLFLAVYWDDHTSQSECDERLECYESPYANDKWSNIYNGAPSDSTVAPSCNWRLNVAKLRGNLIDLRPYYGSGVGHSLNSSVKEIRYFGTRVREYHFALGACIPYANGGLERCSNRKSSKNGISTHSVNAAMSYVVV